MRIPPYLDQLLLPFTSYVFLFAGDPSEASKLLLGVTYILMLTGNSIQNVFSTLENVIFLPPLFNTYKNVKIILLKPSGNFMYHQV
jgi:hypothetical protein